MRENDFQTEFGKRNVIHGVFELKFCDTNSLPFRALEDHQEAALLSAFGDYGLYHRIGDSYNQDCLKKPFDCFFLSHTMAYVVVMFYVPDKKKNVYYIKITDWIDMRERATRKSVTEAMALKHSTIFEDYLR